MIYRNKWARHTLACLLIMCLGLSIKLPSFAGAAQAEATLIVSQEFTVKNGNEPSVGTAIKYKLIPLESGIPMPEGTNAEGEYHFTMDGTAQTIIKMTYDHADVYEYQVQPVIEKEHEGYTYDKAIYDINIYVENGKDGLLLAVIGINQDEEKMGEILYKFSYGIESDDSDRIKTGDSANTLIYMIIGGVSLLVILFFIVSKRKKEDEIDEEDVDEEDVDDEVEIEDIKEEN